MINGNNQTQNTITINQCNYKRNYTLILQTINHT